MPICSRLLTHWLWRAASLADNAAGTIVATAPPATAAAANKFVRFSPLNQGSWPYSWLASGLTIAEVSAAEVVVLGNSLDLEALAPSTSPGRLARGGSVASSHSRSRRRT